MVCLVHCRSLGLLLLECAMGKYPYDASAGPLVLMMQVSSNICQAYTSSHT